MKVQVHEANLVRPVFAETAPVRRELGTAKDDFVVPEDFETPLPEAILDEFEGLGTRANIQPNGCTS